MNLLHDSAGSAGKEYVLPIALIALVGMAGFSAYGTSVSEALAGTSAGEAARAAVGPAQAAESDVSGSGQAAAAPSTSGQAAGDVDDATTAGGVGSKGSKGIDDGSFSKHVGPRTEADDAAGCGWFGLGCRLQDTGAFLAGGLFKVPDLLGKAGSWIVNKTPVGSIGRLAGRAVDFVVNDVFRMDDLRSFLGNGIDRVMDAVGLGGIWNNSFVKGLRGLVRNLWVATPGLGWATHGSESFTQLFNLTKGGTKFVYDTAVSVLGLLENGIGSGIEIIADVDLGYRRSGAFSGFLSGFGELLSVGWNFTGGALFDLAFNRDSFGSDLSHNVDRFLANPVIQDYGARLAAATRPGAEGAEALGSFAGEGLLWWGATAGPVAKAASLRNIVNPIQGAMANSRFGTLRGIAAKIPRVPDRSVVNPHRIAIPAAATAGR